MSPFVAQTPLSSLLLSHASKMQQETGTETGGVPGRDSGERRQEETEETETGLLGRIRPRLPIPGNFGTSSQQKFHSLTAGNKPPADPFRPITMEELSQHRKKGDCWIALEGHVYDVSLYLPYHPGGVSILLSVGGTDATALFYKYHPWVNYKHILQHCRIGVLQSPSTPRGKERRHLETITEMQNNQKETEQTQFLVPSGLPQRKLKDPLRIALSQGGAQPAAPTGGSLGTPVGGPLGGPPAPIPWGPPEADEASRTPQFGSFGGK